MPEMTMSEAAKWAGKSRTTMFKAIKAGRISARRDDAGEYRIDPAELERAFPPASTVNVPGNGSAEQSDTGEKLAALQAENAMLREIAKLHERSADDLRGERDRLLSIVENQTRLLTDDRHKPASGWLSRRLRALIPAAKAST